MGERLSQTDSAALAQKGELERWEGEGRRARGGEGAARRRRRGGRASAAVMAVRERAAAAMAALERRVPSLDDFAGQSWSSWVERADLPAADGE